MLPPTRGKEKRRKNGAYEAKVCVANCCLCSSLTTWIATSSKDSFHAKQRVMRRSQVLNKHRKNRFNRRGSSNPCTESTHSYDTKCRLLLATSVTFASSARRSKDSKVSREGVHGWKGVSLPAGEGVKGEKGQVAVR